MIKNPVCSFLFLSMILLSACTSASGQATSTPTAVLIPYVDANEFLEKANDRIRFKDWNFSLVLPTEDWSLDRFTAKNPSSEITMGTFVRNPLPNHEKSPAVTIIFNRIPNGLGVEQYSVSVMQGKEAYFSNVLERFASGDERITLENAIGFITQYEEREKGEESMAYFIYATHNATGVQVIMTGDLESMQAVQKELESIIGSFQFE